MYSWAWGSGDALSIMLSPRTGGSVQVSGERDFFATMVVDAVSALDVETLDMSLLGVKKVCCSLRQPLPCRAQHPCGRACAGLLVTIACHQKHCFSQINASLQQMVLLSFTANQQQLPVYVLCQVTVWC